MVNLYTAVITVWTRLWYETYTAIIIAIAIWEKKMLSGKWLTSVIALNSWNKLKSLDTPARSLAKYWSSK